MRKIAFIIAALLLAPILPVASAPAAPPPFVPNHKAYAEDERVALTLKAIADAKRFDEVAARRLMPILLVDGLGPEEQDLYFEILAAHSPVSINAPYGPAFDLPPPDGAAREYMSLLKMIIESTNVEATLDGLWLTGPQQMKQLVDISTLGSQLSNTISVYLTRKFAATLKAGNAADGFTPLKDVLGKMRAQLGQTDIDTERRGKNIVYNVLKDMARANNIPDDIYADLKS